MTPEIVAKPAQIDEIDPKTDIQALIDKYSSKWAVSRADMYDLVDCETEHTFDPLIQSKSIRPDGSQENSWGLAQIFLDANTDVTKAQAEDPDFSLNFMGFNLSKDRYWMWKNCWDLVQKTRASKVAP